MASSSLLSVHVVYQRKL